MKIFDTDIFIWIQRGNLKVADLLDQSKERYLSILTYMELLQGAKNRQQHQYIKDFIKSFNFITLPITEKLSYRAAIYIEEYSISCGLRAADSIIAATAVENNLILVSGNKKHYRVIKELKFEVFHP